MAAKMKSESIKSVAQQHRRQRGWRSGSYRRGEMAHRQADMLFGISENIGGMQRRRRGVRNVEGGSMWRQ